MLKGFLCINNNNNNDNNNNNNKSLMFADLPVLHWSIQSVEISINAKSTSLLILCI